MRKQREKKFYLDIVLERNRPNERKKLNELYEHLKFVFYRSTENYFLIVFFYFILKKQKKKKKNEVFDYSALHLLYDPQGLFVRLFHQNKSI